MNVRSAQHDRGAHSTAPLAVYAATDSAALLQSPSLRPLNLTALDASLRSATAAEPTTSDAVAALRARLPPELLAVLLDQLVCAKARVLLLNVFSTFSQMVLSRVGLLHPHELGWVRDVTRTQQRQLGIEVRFLRRINPFDESTLL
eukprot:3117849-Prymnesium_polylepis.1